MTLADRFREAAALHHDAAVAQLLLAAADRLDGRT
jgi:hypothetical protein